MATHPTWQNQHLLGKEPRFKPRPFALMYSVFPLPLTDWWVEGNGDPRHLCSCPEQAEAPHHRAVPKASVPVGLSGLLVQKEDGRCTQSARIYGTRRKRQCLLPCSPTAAKTRISPRWGCQSGEHWKVEVLSRPGWAHDCPFHTNLASTCK